MPGTTASRIDRHPDFKARLESRLRRMRRQARLLDACTAERLPALTREFLHPATTPRTRAKRWL